VIFLHLSCWRLQLLFGLSKRVPTSVAGINCSDRHGSRLRGGLPRSASAHARGLGPSHECPDSPCGPSRCRRSWRVRRGCSPGRPRQTGQNVAAFNKLHPRQGLLVVAKYALGTPIVFATSSFRYGRQCRNIASAQRRTTVAGPSNSDRAERGRILFDHLVPERKCGTCVACCKILDIDKPDLKKPANVLCPHCTGTGCGIYSTRPEICRTWYCLWRRIDVMPEFLRPDKAGVLFSLDQHLPPRTPFELLYIVARAVYDPAIFDTEPIKAALNMFIEEGSLPVWISFDGTKSMIYPEHDFADAIVNPLTTKRLDLVPKAREWRRKYMAISGSGPGPLQTFPLPR
jgi:Fe-S-cluster containining protein